MITSIRRFLLVNLLISITLTTIITTLGSLYLDRRDIQHHFDNQLIQVTLAFQALIAPNLNNKDLQILQRQINQVPKSLSQDNQQINEKSLMEINDTIQYQIWDNNGKLLLHSKNAPNLPLSNGQFGLTTKVQKGHNWRVFTLYNDKTGYSFVVAQRYDLWDRLEARIAKDDAFIVLTIYPLLGVIIWLIVGWGLHPIRKIAHIVSHHDPHNLKPFKIKSVPVEIKPLVDELNHLFVRLEKAFEREKRFTADAAHELKTPLAILKTHAQLALKSNNDENRQVALNNLIAGVDRGAHVVQQLLTLSRSEPDPHAAANFETVDLNALAASLIAELFPLALEKNIEIELNAEQKSITLQANGTALGILLRNLIDNAIRYTPEGGLISVSLYDTAQTTILRVIDNGPGIAKELRERVFERFFRVLGTKSSGSGLGLAIVHQIAELHKAQVKMLTPTEGKGLEVRVIFYKKYCTKMTLPQLPPS